MQRTPETIKSVIVADKQSKSFHIALSVLKNTFDKDVITKALIDSRASINCLDWGFIKRNKLPYYHLPELICAKNVDGSNNKMGIIRFITTMFIWIQGIIHQVLFHIIGCGNKNVILGTPWLEKINPTIDWAKRTVDIPDHTDRTLDYNWKNEIVQRKTTTTPTHANLLPKEYIRDKPIYANENFINYLQGENIAPSINKFKKLDGKFTAVHICKTNIATELAREAGMTEVKLPERYKEFSSIFSKEEAHCFPPSRPYDHTINLDNSFVPKVGKIYPLTPKEQKAMEDFLEENFWLGRIRPLNSPQAAFFFFVNKKDASDTLQPCQDYRYINSHMVKDAFPLPLVQNLINQVKDAKVFTKFNVQWGYNNICIQDGYQWKAAFITHKGLFEPTVMFFGLCNSPATFQRFMNDSFQDMITEGWLIIYMDDLFISIPHTHLNTECTKRVLQRMKELDLHLKIKKCKFGVSHIDYLGMISFPRHIEMDPTKLNGIRNWPTPTKVKDICSFLGFANFYRKFISNYSNIAQSLLDLTKKDTLWNWNNSCQNTFNRLKNCFLTKPVLHLPDTSKPFTIATDASKYASGGILLQTDSNGDWHPCSYLSQLFGPAEWNYDIYDRELLAIICGLKTWHHYLQGSSSPVQVFTNHKNLTFFKEAQKLNRRQAQWMLDLANYNLKLIHVPGSKLCAPDALSWWPNLIPKIDNDNEGITLPPPSLFVNLIDTELNESGNM